MTPNILIAEDDSQSTLWLRLHLQSIWPDCRPCECRRRELPEVIQQEAARSLDLVLFGVDFGTDTTDSFEEFVKARTLSRRQAGLQLIVIATNGNEMDAVRAMRLGANDYLPRLLINAALFEQRLRAALRRARLRVARERRRTERHTPVETAASTMARDPTIALPPPTIPRFKMQKLLGQSSRAAVWLATSEELQKDVAVKISLATTSDTGDQSQFAREYAAIAALDHPGVVEIYDYGLHEGHEYLAMEYFPQGDLKRRMKRRLSPRLSLIYLKRIAEALQPVHQADLMHLDLKPANIMVRDNGSLVLIDFGLVKHMESLAGSTAVGVRRGSPYYMSPEQVNGLKLDARSDIYSLGVVFYEMLTGQRPYSGSSVYDLMDAHVNSQHPPLAPSLASYEQLLDRMMMKNRDDRIANASDLLRELREFSNVGSMRQKSQKRAFA